ncbi:MAG: hypothetical protein R2755_04465 [Acidimicrobiales bacterium]
MARQHRLTRSLLLAAGIGAAATTMVACGDPVDTGELPRVGGERFEEIRFQELYRPPSATSKGHTTVDLVQTESLSLEKSSPEQVVKTYGEVLTARLDRRAGADGQAGSELVRRLDEDGPQHRGHRRVRHRHGGGAEPPTEFQLAFQRPTKTDQITGVGNDPIAG